jgi:hypothetical protein
LQILLEVVVAAAAAAAAAVAMKKDVLFTQIRQSFFVFKQI